MMILVHFLLKEDGILKMDN